MKILITYASKSGTTAKCADMLADRLEGESVEIIDLCESMPNPDDYRA